MMKKRVEKEIRSGDTKKAASNILHEFPISITTIDRRMAMSTLLQSATGSKECAIEKSCDGKDSSDDGACSRKSPGNSECVSFGQETLNHHFPKRKVDVRCDKVSKRLSGLGVDDEDG